MNRFLKEILEQPEALERTLDYYLDPEGKTLLDKLKNIVYSERFEQIIFTGMGSSYFTSHAASSMFNNMEISSFAVNASELLHYNKCLLEKRTMLICFSQSGESYEVREILKILPQSVFSVGITNEAESTLAKNADIVFLSAAGKEEMTSTKTYVVTTLVSFILGWNLSGSWDNDKADMIKRMIRNFRTSLSNYNSWLKPILDFLGDIETIQIIARGPSFSTASQSALMFKEATRIPATGILGGEFRHGPMEMVEEGFKAILFAAKGKTFVQSISMAQDIAEFGGKVLLITNAILQLEDKNIKQVYIDETDEFLFSVQSIIPVQLLIDAYAKERNYEAGSFSRGSKVTLTE